MSTGYQIKEQNKLHFVTLQVVEWVDNSSAKDYVGEKELLDITIHMRQWKTYRQAGGLVKKA